MTKLAQQLGKFQTDIYWLHDARQFNELAQTASQIYLLLGIAKDQSLEIGNLISQAYQLADEAEKYQQLGDFVTELKIYEQAQNNCLAVETILKLSASIAHYQVLWWRCFRHQQWLQVVYYLWKQHQNLPGLQSFYLAYLMSKIGISHNQRNRNQCELLASQYWTILLQQEQQSIPFLC